VVGAKYVSQIESSPFLSAEEKAAALASVRATSDRMEKGEILFDKNEEGINHLIFTKDNRFVKFNSVYNYLLSGNDGCYYFLENNGINKYRLCKVKLNYLSEFNLKLNLFKYSEVFAEKFNCFQVANEIWLTSYSDNLSYKIEENKLTPLKEIYPDINLENTMFYPHLSTNNIFWLAKRQQKYLNCFKISEFKNKITPSGKVNGISFVYKFTNSDNSSFLLKLHDWNNDSLISYNSNKFQRINIDRGKDAILKVNKYFYQIFKNKIEFFNHDLSKKTLFLNNTHLNYNPDRISYFPNKNNLWIVDSMARNKIFHWKNLKDTLSYFVDFQIKYASQYNDSILALIDLNNNLYVWNFYIEKSPKLLLKQKKNFSVK
jgi:hypothetical protein